MLNKTLLQWLEFISNTHPSEIEMGLARIKTVFNALNLNYHATKIVLVAGTNGKGSTVAMIEASLLSLGYRVGTYTSPHIFSYNERVRIDGENVSDSVLVQAFERVESFRQCVPLTYFEYGTLAAFDILFPENLDVVLLEVGLGGRLDAVNIVEPDISIITSVGIDHCDWLGNTVEKIGTEKAGILRHNSLFIGGENMPDTVFEIAKSLSCKALMCRNDFNVISNDYSKDICLDLDSTKSIFHGFPSVLLPESNVLVSLQAVACIFNELNNIKNIDQPIYEKIVNAIESLKLPGRLEKITHKKMLDVYVDVGHNPHAAEFLKLFLLESLNQRKKIQIVYSSLIDKDAFGVLEILSPLVDRCVLTQLITERAMPIDCLVDNAVKSGMKNVLSFASLNDAVSDALLFSFESAKRNEPVLTLIFGSFYIVEAAKRFFETYD
jgi:dihydrofolate synthase/folylpolyglutamate synthase